ncbi:uncharacterized protein LOC120415041 [Culex pipiens pallens]|uniref:uncharacterized protein LOC120415041 n=1 Tax=Culex pipiens pallens TaxID=42434 RepID=UPI00195457AA|nr:uncharacterized protein LOC120415041 [Culex pipiens pallens]
MDTTEESSPDADATTGTYFKRPGTANVGQIYETKILTMVLFRLLHDDQIESFHLGNNLNEAGAFDDVVLRICTGGKVQVYCLQAKHRKATSSVSYEDLVDTQKTKDDFRLKKYFEGFLKIRHAFRPDSDHDIFHGDYEKTELELIIFTPSVLNCPDDEKCERITVNDIFHTGSSRVAVKFKLNSELLEYFVGVSKEWHKKTVAENLIKLIISEGYDTSNIKQSIDKLIGEKILHKLAGQEGTVSWLEIIQTRFYQQEAPIYPKNFHQLCKNAAEIIQEPLLPSHAEHNDLVLDFFTKLQFYPEQATENELDEIIKRDIRAKNYESENLIYSKTLQAVENWWKQTGQVQYQTKNSKIFEMACSEVKIEKIQTVSMNKVKSNVVSFRNETVNNPKLVTMFQKVAESDIFFVNVISNTPELSCVKIIQYFQLLGNNFKFVVVDSAEVTHTLKIFSESQAQCLSIIYLPIVDKRILQALRLKIKQLIVITAHEIAKTVASITDETTNLAELSTVCQENLLESKVAFQGSLVALGLLLDKAPRTLVDAETLQKLVNGEKLVISKSWLPPDFDDADDYYIDRVLLDNRFKPPATKPISEIDEDLVIVAAGPGMGKSTLLIGIAKKIKKLNPANWIIRINLLDYSAHFSQWDEADEDLSESDAMSLLMDAMSYEKTHFQSFEENLFRWYCDQSKIHLLIDGFDEISPDYSDIVIKLLEFYKKKITAKIWVTTRSGGGLEKLQECFQARTYSLKALNIDESKDFLMNFWSRKIKIDLAQRTQIFDDFVKRLFHELSISLLHGELDLISVPLQMKMIATIFQGHFEAYCNATESVFSFQQLDLIDLYEKFIDLKFNVILMEEKHKLNLNQPFIKKQNKNNFQQFQDKHKLAAIYTQFNKTDVDKMISKEQMDTVQNLLNDVENSVEKTGIITRVVDGKPMFVHQTYAEFFAAAFFWEKYVSLKGEPFVTFIKHSLVCLIKEKRVQIAKFLQFMVQKKIKKCSNLPFKARALLDSLLDNAPNCWKDFNTRTFSSLLQIVEESMSSDSECLPQLEKLVSEKSNLIQNILLLKAAENGNFQLVRVVTTVRNDMLNATFDWLEDWTALHFAANGGHLNIVDHLVTMSANVNSVTRENGQTALHMATENGHTSVVELLLNKGADANISMTNTGITALHLAAREGFTGIVSVLLAEHAVIDSATTVDGETSLHIAAGNGHLDIVRNLVKMGAKVNVGTRKNGSTPLHIATKNGHLAIVQTLLANGSLVNAGTTDFGLTPLHWAVRRKNFELATLLLDKGASVDSATNVVGFTPLHFAASSGHAELVDLLLERGTNINIATAEEGWTPLHLAVRKNLGEIVSLLLDKGADIDSIVASDGGTPLQCAAEMGHLEMAQLLIGKGADVNIATKDIGRTALHWAAQNNYTEIVSLLLQSGANIDSGTLKDGKTALDIAIENDNSDLVELLLEKGATARAKESGFTPLHDAARIGSFEVVKWLLSKGVDVSSRRNESDSTPLLEACSRGHFNVVELLIDAGAGVNFGISDTSYMPMHAAARSNSPEIIKLLEKYGANVNCTTTDGRTPLYEASSNLAANAVNMLLNLGADANLFEITEGHTPLHRVAIKKHDDAVSRKDALEIARALLNHGASYLPIRSGLNPLHAAATGGSEEILELLLEQGSGIDINSYCQAITKNYAATPLCQACANGNLKAAQVLLKQGANMHLAATIASNVALKPIHWAARSDSADIIQLLAAHGADINSTTTDNGRTPLYFACVYNAKQALRVLLDMGANTDLCTTNGEWQGWKPLHRAAQRGLLEVVEILINHGASIDPTESGLTALHAVATGGSSEILESLLEKNIDINGKWGEDEVTPLFQACFYKHSNIVKLLLEHGADVNLGTCNGYMPIHQAARNDCTEIMELLVSKGANINCTTTDNGHTPLFEATLHNAKHAVKLLLDMGANAELNDTKEGKSPLQIAAETDKFEILSILVNHGDSVHRAKPELTGVNAVPKGVSKEVVDFLQERDIRINSQRKHVAITPLFQACSEGNLSFVQLLLDRGADVMLGRSNIGYMPIHCAAANDRVKVIQLLLASGANINCTTLDNGRTPLYEAASNGAKNAVKYLLEMGADAELADTSEGLTPLLKAAGTDHLEVVRALLNHGVSVRPNASGFTALHAVAIGGSREILELLLVTNIDINSKWSGNNKKTPLYLACAKDHLAIVQLLLDKGADVHLGKHTNEYMPLHWAAFNDSTEVIKLLVAKGADINCATSRVRKTPLDEAERNNAKNAIKLLQEIATNISNKNINKKRRYMQIKASDSDEPNVKLSKVV